MNDYEKLSHTTWECKYHVVFIPKYRKKVLFGTLKKELGRIFHKLAEQRESKIEEGHVMVDHVHMMLSIPPKLSVSHVVGYIKGRTRDSTNFSCCNSATFRWFTRPLASGANLKPL